MLHCGQGNSLTETSLMLGLVVSISLAVTVHGRLVVSVSLAVTVHVGFVVSISLALTVMLSV